MSFYIEDRDNGTKWVRIYYQADNPNMNEISRWCKENDCGKQVSITAISFKNDSDLTMFLLRWQGERN